MSHSLSNSECLPDSYRICSTPSIKSIHCQQSLLVLINSYLLKRLLKASIEVDYDATYFSISCLAGELFTYFQKIGHVSQHFYESAVSGLKLFFQSNTLSVCSEDLPLLSGVTSLFKARPNSIFLVCISGHCSD
ncbi:hypothetical protein GEMRC1_011461 [Eukaryota sp. GEM-RC1]